VLIEIRGGTFKNANSANLFPQDYPKAESSGPRGLYFTPCPPVSALSPVRLMQILKAFGKTRINPWSAPGGESFGAQPEAA
jgi:hypothetical protein